MNSLAYHRMYTGKTWGTTAFFALAACIILSDPTVAQISQREALLRTGYIHNFTKYVTWPEDAFTNSNDPFVIGVYGDSALDKYLSRVAKSRKVGDRKIKLVRFESIEACGDCHLLYVPTVLNEKEGVRLSTTLKGKHTLVVGEHESLLKQGGTIVFFVKNNLLNLKIYVPSAKARKLSIRSQLMRLDVVEPVN